jgi:hypothetical protein
MIILDKDNAVCYGLKYDESDAGLRYAAKHLNTYLDKCAKLSLEKYINQKCFISIGYNDLSKNVIKENPISKNHYDGYRILFRENNVYIFGGHIRSTIYGVYAFIEKFLGVRWFHKNAEYVPEKSAIEIKQEDIFEYSYFPQRELTYLPFTTDWELSMHFRYVSPNVKENSDVGQVNLWYNKIPTTHNTHYYVPFEKVKEHPEYFRKAQQEKEVVDIFTSCGLGSSSLDLCYSNGITDDGEFDEGLEFSAAREVANKLLEFILEDRSKKFFMFGLQDNRSIKCFCPKCIEKRNKYGTEAGVVIIFLNAVIKKVEQMLVEKGVEPDFNVVVFAYHNTVEPPVKNNKPIDELVIPHEKLHVRYAPIDANYTYSLFDERQKENVKRQLEGWSTLTKNLMMWDYNTNYMECSWFFPILPNIAKNIKGYAEIGASYLFNEGSDTGNSNWQQELYSYVISKLYWNYNLDVWSTAFEYVDGYYGIAASKVKQFIKVMQSHCEDQISKGMEISILNAYGDIFNPEHYPFDFLVEQVNLLESAIEDVKNSSLSKNNKKELIIRLKRVLVTPLRMINKNSEYYFGKEENPYFEKYDQIVNSVKIENVGSGPMALEITDNYSSDYKIVIGQNPTKEEISAAEYFQERIEKMSGVSLPIVDDTKVAPAYPTKAICIGNNRMFKEFFKGQVEISKYKYYISTLGCCLFIHSIYDLHEAVDNAFVGMFANAIKHPGFAKVVCPKRLDFEYVD